jgi:uncharacterized membrane protein
MLTAFGVFWLGEGLGADWLGADLALLYILASLAAVSAGTVSLARRATPKARSL